MSVEDKGEDRARKSPQKHRPHQPHTPANARNTCKIRNFYAVDPRPILTIAVDSGVHYRPHKTPSNTRFSIVTVDAVDVLGGSSALSRANSTHLWIKRIRDRRQEPLQSPLKGR